METVRVSTSIGHGTQIANDIGAKVVSDKSESYIVQRMLPGG